MKLDHIQIAMPNGEEEKARAFFSSILEMKGEPKPHPLNQRGGCWFRKGTVIVHMGVETDFSPQKKAHPAFAVPDIKELEKRLVEDGYEITWDNALPSRIRSYSSDPFGKRIEFLRDGDGFAQ